VSWVSSDKCFFYSRLQKLGPGMMDLDKELNETAYLRCFYRDCSQERPRAGLGSFPSSGDAEDEQTGQRVSGSRAVLQFECSALVRVREPNHFRASR